MKPHDRLVFEETFSTHQLHPDTWNIEVGEKWANEEKQCYVNHPKNIQFTDRGLKLVADMNPGVSPCLYQSARINTKGKKEWQYGTFVIRAAIPKGQGSWPDIWILGHDIGKVRWPLCGEIDLMETVGRDPEVMHFSLHSQKHNHIIRTQRTHFEKVPGIAEGFHDYKMIWRPEGFQFFIDDILYATFEKVPGDSVESWPFDKPYYLIMNIAVGGTWGGVIDPATLPYAMEVTSIKVYQS
jgi:beta-glucanase (GH16 family)